ncbi:hypothetical protein PYCCODRAFT_997507 [Trametes coccinea BRFM310]|uniref:F-box domain-containing protein n=1 Tax=Trametes coccinea (strain BRFM310) TaxID=1353009 RepID=A0A1Y2IBD9_TRAC3|nr:hypothetical protein PYCCODRAFT_997507 [Trametes coccinea BRFM310]
MDDLGPLFKRLTTLRKHFSRGDECRVPDGILPADWARFQHYAERVRELQSTIYFEKVHQSVWVLLQSVLGSKPLLPNLRRLDLSISVKEPAGHLLLISPTIRNLETLFEAARDDRARSGYDPVREAAGVLLELILSKVPNLLTLCVDARIYGHFPAHQLGPIQSLFHLQTLKLSEGSDMDYVTVQLLSRLPSLRSLGLSVRLSSAIRKTRMPAAGNFAALHELSLLGCLADVVWVFDAFSFNALDEKLHLTLLDPATDINVKERLAEIMSKVPRNLRALTLLSAGIQVSSENHLSLSTVLESCLVFEDAVTVDIKFRFSARVPQVTDCDLLKFAQAWPKLESLRLNDFPQISSAVDEATASHVTLRGLLSLSQHCPNLLVMQLQILDVTEVPPVSSFPAVGHKYMRQLQITQLRNGSTANLLDVAVIIDLLFPLLETRRRVFLQYPPGRKRFDLTMVNGAWDMTQALLAAIQARREVQDSPMASRSPLTEDSYTEDESVYTDDNSDDEDGDDDGGDMLDYQ